MIKNYLKVALRNIKRSKIYSFVNISGLAVGMACCFLIFLYVQHEFSYDRFHEKSDQIYRVTTEWQVEGQSRIHQTTAAPVAPALMNDFPEVQNTVRIRRTGAIIYHGGESFVERRVYLVDPSFFDIFNFPLLRGNPETAFQSPYSMVLTEKSAEKYFGREDPIGKILNIGKRFDFEVTGIAKDVPPNSHLDFDFLVRFDFINDYTSFNYLGSWGAWNFHTYVLLQKDFSPFDFMKKTPAFIKKYRGTDSTNPQRLHLQPLTQINLETNGKLKYIYFFSAIAVIILILVCVNFMNLSVARSSARVREIGMRKVMGAKRPQLIKQFMGESIVMAFLALPLALLLAYTVLPAFNSLLMTRLQTNYFQSLPFILSIFGITLVASLISGSYPALYLSAFKPVQSLRGELKSRKGILRLRSLLVIFQFSVSIILIISTIAIYHQMKYIQNRDLGFNKDFIVNVSIFEPGLRQKSDYVKSELLENPSISSATVSSFYPGSHPNQSVDWEGRKEDQELMMAWYSVDHDFIRTFEMKIVEGRDFSRELPSDIQSAYILNETAAKAFGWESGVGKQFMVERADLTMGRVIGVMKDFHFASLHHNIRPLALVLDPEGGDHFSLKITPKNMSETLSFIEKKFKEFAPNAPFHYSFMDDEIAELYMEEERLGKLISSFSVLAVLIACLGLLGLASFSISRRTKEIGIRKVLGASVSNIIILLTGEFSKLVLLANIIAWPIAFYAMKKWLQNFAYRMDIGLWLFILAAFLALLIAVLTTGYHAIKAAKANPSDSLRYE
jgi:putative ABC transport system permease protein